MRLAEAANIPILLLTKAEPDDVLAIAGEVVLDRDTASRAERQVVARALVLIQPAVDDIGVAGRPKAGVTDGELADPLRRDHVAFDQSRRDGENIRDIVEPVLLVVGRQQGMCIHVEPEQVANGVGVLDPVEPVDGWAARIGRGHRRAVELGLEPRHERARRGGIGSGPARGRHRVRAQLADDFFPHVRAGTDLLDVGLVEHEASCLEFFVVAGDAILIEQRTRRHRDSGGGRDRRLRMGRSRSQRRSHGAGQPNRLEVKMAGSRQHHTRDGDAGRHPS